MSTDGYDFLCDLAQLDGIRICPLFRVFWSLEGWQVRSTTAAGDPEGPVHSTHVELRDAYDEANNLNRPTEGKPELDINPDEPLPFADRVLAWLRYQCPEMGDDSL